MRFIEVFLKYRWLLYELVIRDLKIKYRRSVLGYLWSVLNPLMMMIVLTIVFSTFFKFDIPNYPVYLMSGQMIYSFYAEATSMAMTSIISSGNLIKKVYVPKYIFALSRVISSFLTFIFSLIAILVMMFATNVEFSWTMVLFPLPLIYIFVFSLGIGLILSVVAVYFRDVVHLYGVLLTAWMYLTPIIYPLSMVPEYVKAIILLNPMYYFVEVFRDIILYGQVSTVEMHMVCIINAILSFSIGVCVFYKNQRNFILYI